MITLTKHVNQYRTISVNFLSFPIPVQNIIFEGYIKNDGVSKMKGIDVYNFDTISYLSTSEKGVIHALGCIGTQVYVILLRELN